MPRRLPLVALLSLLVVRPVVAQQSALTAGIDSIVRAVVDSGKVAGIVVGVMVGNDTILLKGYGQANTDFQTAMTADAVFEIASNTKQFTAAAILKLRDQGKLSLDDDLSKHLPEYPLNGRRVSIARLLDHTSGIRSYTDTPWFVPGLEEGYTRDELVARFSAEPFDFEPGDALIYNNSGYILLGLIIERVSGMPYAEYVTQQVLAPSGMTRTTFCPLRSASEPRVRGYQLTPDGFGLAMPWRLDWPAADGTLCSTAGDLLTWTRALHGGRVLPAATYREMLTPRPLADGRLPRYAKGLTHSTLAGHPTITHGGALPGIVSDMHYLPERRATIVVMMNTMGPLMPGMMAERIARRLFGEAKSTNAPPRFAGNLEAFTGTFRGRGRGGDFTVELSQRDGKLHLQGGIAPNGIALEYLRITRQRRKKLVVSTRMATEPDDVSVRLFRELCKSSNQVGEARYFPFKKHSVGLG